MPPKKRKSLTPAQRDVYSKRQQLRHSQQRLQRLNASAPAVPPKNLAAASAAADLPSAKRNNSASTPTNGSSAQFPIRPATVSTPVPRNYECRLR